MTRCARVRRMWLIQAATVAYRGEGSAVGQQPNGAGNLTRVVLVTGLWPYRDYDRRMSLGKLNVVHNAELRDLLTSAVGVDSVFEVGYRAPDGVIKPLFRPIARVEPTLVSVALRSLVPSGVEVADFQIEEVLDEGSAALADIAAHAHATICLVSTTYITNFRAFDRLISTLRGVGVRFIAAGGFLASRNPEAAIEHGADAAVAGDGEDAVPELIDALRGDRDLGCVTNLVYRGPDGLPVGPLRQRLVAVDDIEVAIPEGDLSSMVIPYESMRGCPYKCAFCSYPLVSTKWRYKSARKIIDDFRAIEERGATHIVALDSTFTIPYKRLREFLSMYMDSGLSIPWGAYSRVTPLKNPDVVRDLRRANNTWLSVGFESGSQQMLDKMKKGTKLVDGVAALRNLEHYGISPWSNFLVGYPGETHETVAETVSFMSNLIFGFYALHLFNVRDRAMPVLEDPTANLHYDEIGTDWSHATLDSEEASELRRQAYIDVALANERAINIDVYRGTNVETQGSAWSESFPTLKAIERFALAEMVPREVQARGVSPDEVRRRLMDMVAPVAAPTEMAGVG